MNLEYEMTYRVRVRGPLPATSGSPLGERQYWEMTDAELTGERINAHLAMPGGDWYRAGADGLGRPDVRVQLQTDDGEVVLLHYTGIVQPTEAFKKVSERGGETRFEDQHIRMVMFFETGAARHAWLNQNVFVAEGRLIERDRLEYRIYRLA
jgi:hypothetical protein